MKIRLLAIDSKIPNYAIMKISSYYKSKGDDVDWYNPMLDYQDTDILYISKVFAFSEDPQNFIPMPINAKIILGGTGYDYKSKLPEEIENVKKLDYSLYPNCNYSVLFTTRGCIRNCSFCIVPKKEGIIHNVQIANLNPNGKYIMLLDNNFFANKTWRENLEILKSFNQPIDFTSGIDLRILDKEQAESLSHLKIKKMHCAWDNYNEKDKILPKIKLLCKYIKPYKITVYCLVGFEKKQITETDLERVMTLKKIGVKPFVMVYQDFNDNKFEKSLECKQFARWCNRKELLNTCTWEEYKKTRGNRV